MPPLNRAFALEQMDDVAVGVRDNLDLDVTGLLDQPLDVQRAIADSGDRFATRGSGGVRHLV